MRVAADGQSGCTAIAGVDDAAEFAAVVKAILVHWPCAFLDTIHTAHFSPSDARTYSRPWTFSASLPASGNTVLPCYPRCCIWATWSSRKC